jgi:hypothetical protein
MTLISIAAVAHLEQPQLLFLRQQKLADVLEVTVMRMDA